ncbi:chloride channel protein [Filimonas effusa]|uniref:Chloride channel protein n=1 Tax=Filimonas effusa TaxID=2508721 RepID=A0A4Q1D9R9_9BACT|nr:chloride channel protein [Filimonas effusa]RXK85608.1 chloride channel protein [Filimonas effusa]
MIRFFHKYIRKGITYIKEKLTERQFLLFACIIVGAAASLAAVALKLLVFHLEETFFSHTAPGNVMWYQVLMPIAGIGLSAFFIHRFFKKDFLKGNDKIVYAIAKDNANLPVSQVYSHIVTSSITVGLGGSAGLESPMVATGAAIGSNFGKLSYLPYREKTVLLACGIAAGIASAFSAPIAGVLFALEVLMIDITITTFIPLIISAATGALLARIILGDNILLSFNNLHAFNYNNTLFYVVIGVFCGLTALYYTRVYTWLEHRFAHMRGAMQRWLWGSLLLAVLIFCFPPLFGEGYHIIKLLADNNRLHSNSFLLNHFNSNWALLLFLVGVILFKVFATAFTVQGGGNGGSFAPALFIGGVLGFVIARLFVLMGYEDVPTANFVVAGMAGMLSGVFFAPLTAIFLSAEITGGYSLIIPLMLVAAISFFVVKSFEPLSMEMKKLSLSSRLNPSDRDKFMLSRLELAHIIDRSYLQFNLNTSLPEIAKQISRDQKDVYAVINENKKLAGVIYLNDIKSLMIDDLNRNLHTRAADVMIKPRFLSINDDVETALYAFEQSNTHTLAVVTEEGEWAGFITKSAILDRYRQEILNVSYN